MVTIIDTDAVSLWYYPETCIVHHEIRRCVHGDEFRALLERGLDVLQKRHATKWLSDNRGNGPVKPADHEWALNEWMPRGLTAGWSHWAVVMPKKVLGQMNTRRRMEDFTNLGIAARAGARRKGHRRSPVNWPSSMPHVWSAHSVSMQG